MKKTLLFFAAAAVLAAACQPEGPANTKKEEEEKASLAVTATSIDVAPEATEAVIAITSNVDWTVECDSEDLSLSATSGTGDGSVTVTMPANGSFAAVTYIVTVSSAATEPVVVTINHKPVVPVISASAISSPKFSDYQATVDITSNIPWKIEHSENLTVDIDAFEGDTTVALTFAINLESKAVEYSLTISSDSTGLDANPVVIKFTQEAFTGTLCVDSLVFRNAIGGSKNVNVSLEPYKSAGEAFSLTFEAGSNANPPKYYWESAHVRVYSGNITTIASTIGKKIVKIEFVTTEDYELSKSSSSTTDSGYLEGLNVWKGYADAVAFTKNAANSAQVRPQKVFVSYVQ